jgi:hypothetical protein
MPDSILSEKRTRVRFSDVDALKENQENLNSFSDNYRDN